ncbi:hypothetical protein CYA_0854 [Synechococcus sp. JA-3-3Ab]|nr:hypothetical protein CYA_0854 [Synechococcus sp. JA-3-3Ab]
MFSGHSKHLSQVYLIDFFFGAALWMSGFPFC